MRFPLKKFLEIGVPLALGGVSLGGGALPAVINQRQKRLGHKDDPAQGHEYIALGMRQLVQASFPDEVADQFDAIAFAYSAIAAQEQADIEAQQREDRKKKKPKRRRKIRKTR